MLAEERREALLRMVERRGAIKVKEVAEEMEVSAVTLRQDVRDLAGRGLVVRVHGGAMSLAAAQGASTAGFRRAPAHSAAGACLRAGRSAGGLLLPRDHPRCAGCGAHARSAHSARGFRRDAGGQPGAGTAARRGGRRWSAVDAARRTRTRGTDRAVAGKPRHSGRSRGPPSRMGRPGGWSRSRPTMPLVRAWRSGTLPSWDTSGSPWSPGQRAPTRL